MQPSMLKVFSLFDFGVKDYIGAFLFKLLNSGYFLDHKLFFMYPVKIYT